MEYWQGIVIAATGIGIFFGAFALGGFLRRKRGSQPEAWQDEMAMRASEFVNRHGGP